MPQGLDSTDRKLLTGVGILFVILVVVSAEISRPRVAGASQTPSTYSPSWDGAKAAFLLLQQLGYDVSRWEETPTELPQGRENEVLILAEPAQPASEAERSAIIDFLENGGRVIATGESAGKFLPDASKFQQGSELEGKETFDAMLPSPITRGAPQISMLPPRNWEPHSLKQLVLYGNQETAAVITYRFGKGEVIWWAAATPLTNGGITDPGNLIFFLNCVGPPGRMHILWDEYFHGVRGSIWGFFAQTPAFWGVAQFGLVFLAIMFTFSRRLGPIRPPAVQSRLSSLEFVDTLGDLYASAHVSAAAVDIAYRRLRFVLTRRLGLPGTIAVSDLAKSASESLGWEEVPLLRVLSRGEQASKSASATVKDPVQLVQQLHDYLTRLEVVRPSQMKGKQNE